MSTDIEKKEFVVSDVPHGVILAAKRADGDMPAFIEDIEFDFPELQLRSEHLRQIIAYVAEEKSLDIIAGTPNSTEALTRLINDSMYREIQRLNREVRILTKIAESDPDEDYRIKHTGEVINPTIARARLDVAMDQMATYSKLINDKTKAEAAGADNSVNVNMQFNLPALVTEGLQRLDAVVIDKEVETL